MSDAWNPGSQPPSGYVPAPYRPLSALAVIGLVLAIVFLIGTTAFWWIEALPILLCVVAWGAISKGQRRGGGLAIAASVIAILGALAGFGCAQGARTTVRSTAAPFVQALHDDDREALERWATEDPAHPIGERAALWKQRLDEGRSRAGLWTREIELAGSIWMPFRFVAFGEPSEYEEVGPKPKDTEPAFTFWIRAPGTRGDLWIGAVADPRVVSKRIEERANSKADEKKPWHLVDDVRVFVPVGLK